MNIYIYSLIIVIVDTFLSDPNPSLRNTKLHFYG